MASVFGTPVNDYTQYAKGEFGYIIKVNLTAHLFEIVTGVQAEYAEFRMVDPVNKEVDINTLYSYLNDENPPDIAFNWGNGVLSIFFKDDGQQVPAWAGDIQWGVGQYVTGAISGVTAIFKCITAGLGEDAGTPPTWAETGDIADNEAVWNFVKYVPIPATLPYGANTRFAAFGRRKIQKVAVDADKLDIPDKDIRLLLNYALRSVWNIKKKHIPKEITDIIEQEEARIRNEQ